MKKLLKKITAIVMAAAISVSAMVVTTTSASAAGVFDGAKKMEALEYYNVQLSAQNEHELYKITLTKSGDLTLRFNECRKMNCIVLYNKDAEKIYERLSIGQWGIAGTISNGEYVIENLSKGTYYLDLYNSDADDAFFKDLYYIFTPDNKPTLSFKITVNKGDTLQLGAFTTNYDGKVTWQTTKKTVATVTSKGKVTAKSAGTAVIRATLDDGTYVQIRVVVKNK